MTPRIEISLSKIQENARVLVAQYGQKGISVTGVSKAVLGEPSIIRAILAGGITDIADSRIENIETMRRAGLVARFILLRTPISRAESVVQSADISLNTEMDTLKALSAQAKHQNKLHQVIIMVEMGDLREGVIPTDLLAFVRHASTLTNLKVVGVGCNLACYGGVEPDTTKMNELSRLATMIESECGISLSIISGGNSANYEWFQQSDEVGRVNNLRIGESILLGCETLTRTPIPGLHLDAFQLVAEVIEAKEKPSLPEGNIGQDAFGNVPNFTDQGLMLRLIMAIGRQDTCIEGLCPKGNFEILGASSDHLILDGKTKLVQIGDELGFSLDYAALLGAMTSPFVHKQLVL